MEEANLRRQGISEDKSKEYSRGDDVLRNFKEVGRRLGLDPSVVACVYLNKHIDSINTFIDKAKDLETQELKGFMNEGEGIISRLDDARNYLDLLECILLERIHGPADANAGDGSSVR